MRKWLYDNPWIWIVLLLALLLAGSIATLVIAERNKPEILPRTELSEPGGIDLPVVA